MKTPIAPRPRARVALALLLAGLAGALVGCGHCCDDDDWYGHVYVDNLTHASTNEFVLGFAVAPFGQPWTGNLLASPLPPGSTEFVGTFHEDWYDAWAELELGDLVEWFDVWVGGAEDVFFEVY